MSIKINTDNGTAEMFTIVLSGRNHNHYGEIHNITGMRYKGSLGDEELCFTVHKYANGIKERLWDKITDFRFVWIKELNKYLEIRVSSKKSNSCTKVITAISPCKSELSQRYLYNIEINTETDIARDDYEPTIFYNPENLKVSLLHRVLEKAPSYTIKYVSSSLAKMQRMFSINGMTLYDFFTGECAKEFNCIFLFDSTDRSISVYDLYTVCNDCGERGEYTDVCPNCGGTNLNYFGEDTTILVSTDNLTDEIRYEVNTDGVKNTFKLEAGDDTMTATVMAYIPNGGNSITHISTEQMDDMSDELVEKINSYNDLYDSYTDEYLQLMKDLYEAIERQVYYESKQMPNVELSETTAQTEAKKLIQPALNPLALSSLSEYTSVSTVNSALVNYSKVFINSGSVKVEVDTGSTFVYNQEVNGVNYGTWTGRLKLTNYANKEDIAYTDNMTLSVTDDYGTFLQEKVMKNISGNNTEDGSVYDVLSVENINTFKNALTEYCLSRLKSFRDAINSVLTVLQESGEGSVGAEFYNDMYTPYYQKKVACDEEITIRQATINEWKSVEIELTERKTYIQNELNFENYLGSDLYKEYANFIREDVYSNSNYISDGLSDEELFERAQEFIEVAQKELIKASHYKHSISANMYNLLLMEEFEPIVEKFELGNWIRIECDDVIYRLRLISFEIDFDNLGNINTDFSDVTKTADGMSDVEEILKQASSMATSYDSVSNQASKGNNAQNQLINFVEEGLNSALINIMNNDNQEFVMDENGILGRQFDDTTGEYSPEQMRITNNILVYSDDGFRSASLGLGKHTYYKYVDGILTKDVGYGISCKFGNYAYLYGSQMISGDIYSENYSPTSGTHFDLNTGAFTLAGGRIVYDGKDSLIFRDVSLLWEDIDDAPTNISEFNNDANYQNAIQVTQITKDTVTAPFIETLKLEVGKEIIMGEDAVISWGQVTGTDNIATTSDIPTKLSQLANDSNFQNAIQVTQITKDTVTAPFIQTLGLTVGNEILMGENATISWSKVTNQPTILTSTDVTTITNNTLATTNVVAQNLQVNFANILGTLQGKDIVLGGKDNGDGSLTVKNADGFVICTIDKNGIKVNSTAFSFSDSLVVLDGVTFNGSGYTYSGFIADSGNPYLGVCLYSECSSGISEEGEEADEAVVNSVIAGIDMTGYSKMTVVISGLVGANYGLAYANYGIDAATSDENATNQVFHSSEYVGVTTDNFTIEINIANYTGKHKLCFYQYARSDSSSPSFGAYAELGVKSITLSN